MLSVNYISKTYIAIPSFREMVIKEWGGKYQYI